MGSDASILEIDGISKEFFGGCLLSPPRIET